MEQKNLFKIIAAILLVINIVNAILFFNQLSGPISTSPAGQQMFRTSMYAFMIITLVITVFFFVLVWRSTQKIQEETELAATTEEEDKENAKEDQEAERRKNEEEQRAKEQKRVDEKIHNIMNDLDQERDIERYGKKLLSQIADQESIVQGLFFIKQYDTGKFTLKSEFAFYGEHEIKDFEEGDGLNGQVAVNQEILKIDEIPEGYVKIYSGLGKSDPRYMMFIPVVRNEETIALIELASFNDFDQAYKKIYNAVSKQVAEQLETLMSNINA